MNIDLERAIKSAMSDIVAAAPEAIDRPTDVRITSTSEGAPRRWTPAVAAVLVLAAGVTGIALFNRENPPDAGPVATATSVAVSSDDATTELSAPTTTAQLPSTPSPDATVDSACADGKAETTVPNVEGLGHRAATDRLVAAGLDYRVAREVVSGGVQPELGDEHVIVSQDPEPGTLIACGAIVELSATTLPVYVIQPGDTWESIAAAHGIGVDELLGFNGLTTKDLENNAGVSGPFPFEVGRVIRLSATYNSLSAAPPTTG